MTTNRKTDYRFSTWLTLGATRYGEPNGDVRAALESSGYDRLQQIAAQLLVAQSWEELLAGV